MQYNTYFTFYFDIMKSLFKFILITIFGINLAFANVEQNDKQKVNQAIYKVIYSLNSFTQGNYPNSIKLQFLQTNILPLFDFEYINKQIIPANLKLQNPWMQNLVKQDIVNTIMQNLYKSRGKFFTPLGVSTKNNNIIIAFKVHNYKLDLVMHKKGNNWLIIDVLINNYGLIDYYKQKFSKAAR